MPKRPPTQVRVVITHRTTLESGHVIRHLACGHDQDEQSGGKASAASFAYCTACQQGKPAPERVIPAEAVPATPGETVTVIAASPHVLPGLQKALDGIVGSLTSKEREVLDSRFPTGTMAGTMVITTEEEGLLLRLAREPEAFKEIAPRLTQPVLDVARYIVGYDRTPLARIARQGDAIKARAFVP